MAVTDVNITSSLGSVIGATINLQVGAIPMVSLDLRPGGGVRIVGGGSFPDIDSRRRQSLESVEISVRVRKGSGGQASRSFRFKGVLDGYSISNTVGNNSYQAVLKHEAQCLLELTTLMPGLYPASSNIFKIASHSLETSAQGEEGESVKLWTQIATGEILKLSPIKFYVALLKAIIEKQEGGWEKYAGTDKMVSNEQAFKAIFDSAQYKANLKKAKKILNSIDFSGCSGDIDKISNENRSIDIQNIFASGPTIMLESLQNFLSTVGCSIIFGADKHYIVPINSVIKQQQYSPGVGQLSTTTNCAGPADYNSYSFSDIGYRDVNSVILISPNYTGGYTLGDDKSDRGVLACFSAPDGEAKGSGVYVVRAHPWAFLSATSPQPNDAQKAKIELDGSNSPYAKKKSFKEAAEAAKKTHAARSKEKENQTKDLAGKHLKNYAETKYYQARFTDRQGTITMDFNPNWVPGTGGVLYVRESQMFLHFYVHSVTHRVETGPPTTGSAITVVNFNCGRFGKNPAGSEGDDFLGYTQGIEKNIREAYASSYK